MEQTINVRVCLDSDVLIEVQRGNEDALQQLVFAERLGPLAISVVVRMELTIGSRNKEMLARTHKLLRRFQVLPLNEEISVTADALVTQFHLSNGMRLADALIAATALAHDAPLLTRNQRDFRFIPGLKLLPYPPTA